MRAVTVTVGLGLVIFQGLCMDYHTEDMSTVFSIATTTKQLLR